MCMLLRAANAAMFLYRYTRATVKTVADTAGDEPNEELLVGLIKRSSS